MIKRPKIKIQLSAFDKITEITGWVAVLYIWVITAAGYSDLPDIIPIHYNSSGQADGFGGKELILTLPLISTVLYIVLTALNRFPHVFNYPVQITEHNALRQYTNSVKLIRLLKLIIVIVFGFIAFKTVQTANGEAQGLGRWFLPVTIGFIFVPIIYYVIKSFKIK